MNPSERRSEIGSRAVLGPLLLLVPVLLGTLAAVHLLGRRGPAGPPLSIDRGGAPAVSGWEGAIAPPAGGRLAARLTPLHADPNRQAFDAAALRARYPELPPGAPYRLELAFDPPPASESGTAPGGAPALSIADLSVGADLLPLSSHLRVRAEGGVHDPLAVLLTARADSLAPGEQVQVVLWGEVGAGAPSVVLGGPPDALVRVPLAAADVLRGDLPQDLARSPAHRSPAGAARPEEPR